MRRSASEMRRPIFFSMLILISAYLPLFLLERVERRLFMPMAFGLMLLAPIGAGLVGKVEPRIVIAVSTLVAAAGMLMLMGLDPRSGPLDIMIPILVIAGGMGFGMAQRTNIIASAVPTEEIGVASSSSMGGLFSDLEWGYVFAFGIFVVLMEGRRGVPAQWIALGVLARV